MQSNSSHSVSSDPLIQETGREKKIASNWISCEQSGLFR